MSLNKTDLDNAKLDVEHLAALATSDALTAEDRLGNIKKTWAGIEADLSAEYAITQTGANRLATEAARDAAIIGAGVYETEAAGRAASADGQYFKVAGDGLLIAAREYRRVNSGASVLVAIYPAIAALARYRSVDYFDIGDNTRILAAGDTFSIGHFRYGKPDGTFVAYTDTLTDNLATPGANAYIVMDARGSAISLAVGGRAHAWEEIPYLDAGMAILAYKEVGVWRSQIVGVQRLLDAFNNRLVPRVFDIAGGTAVRADSVFKISVFRYGRKDGTFIAYDANETFSTPGTDHYIVCDVSGAAPVLSLGTRPHAWEEVPYLTPDRFIFAWKEVGQWKSDFPAIQRLIEGGQLRAADYYDIGDTTKITRADTAFSITAFRHAREDGSFIAYDGGTLSTPNANDYIVMDYSGSAISMAVGTHGHAWEEAPYLTKGKRIFAFKEVGVWRSHIVGVQRLLDRYNAGQDRPIVYVEKVVKLDGTVGVDCDFTSIMAALDALSDGTYYRRYIIQVMDGEYDYSDSGRPFLGFRPYTTVKGRARGAVRVVMRHPTFDSYHATFDPVAYGQVLGYASLQNLVVVCANGKGPVHIDSAAWGKGVIETVDCVFINEDGLGALHYQIGLASGVHQGQTVRAIRCSAPDGVIYAHTAELDYLGPVGGRFECIGCDMLYTMIGDLQTYGQDFYRFEGCRIDEVRYQIADGFGVRWYLQPAIETVFVGCDIERVTPQLFVAGHAVDALWDDVFGGKFGLCIPSLHAVHRCTTGTISRGSPVALAPSGTGYIKPWATGDGLYGIALDNFTGPNDFGAVQYRGTVNMPCDTRVTPIHYDDELEMASTGQVVKRTTGRLVGWARGEESGREWGILVKLAR